LPDLVKLSLKFIQHGFRTMPARVRLCYFDESYILFRVKWFGILLVKLIC